MEKGYEMFITDLRRLLLAAMDMEEEKIYFAKKGEKYGCAYCEAKRPDLRSKTVAFRF